MSLFDGEHVGILLCNCIEVQINMPNA